MESSGDISNLLGTSISETSKEVDLLSSLQSALITGSTLAADQQSDDQSLNPNNRPKISLTYTDPQERTSPAKPPVTMFAQTPESTLIADKQSNDQPFDATSRQKLSLTCTGPKERIGLEKPVSMFTLTAESILAIDTQSDDQSLDPTSPQKLSLTSTGTQEKNSPGKPPVSMFALTPGSMPTNKHSDNQSLDSTSSQKLSLTKADPQKMISPGKPPVSMFALTPGSTLSVDKQSDNQLLDVISPQNVSLTCTDLSEKISPSKLSISIFAPTPELTAVNQQSNIQSLHPISEQKLSLTTTDLLENRDPVKPSISMLALSPESMVAGGQSLGSISEQKLVLTITDPLEKTCPSKPPITMFALTPGSTLVADSSRSEDQLFDIISRQKLNLTLSSPEERISPVKPPISMFEEDTRSSWSVEPAKQTPFKETTLDEDSQSIQTPYLKNRQELTKEEEMLEDDSQVSVSEQIPFKETQIDEDSHNSVINQAPFKGSELNDSINSVNEVDNSQNSINGTIEFKGNVAMDEDSQMAIDNIIPPKNPLADENSQNAYMSMEEQPQTLTPFKETALDEDSQKSVGSQKSTSKIQQSTEGEDKDHRAFPPENLIEYMWPQENGEFFILQEQICDYLNVKSFKRKYPDLVRRPVEVDERQFLEDKAIVSKLQCDLGLTALRSEEVLELMSKDYPEQYKEYIRVLREKEQQSVSEKQREFAATNADKTKMVDLVKKAMQSAAEYNAHLNQERREERKSCMDLQTFTIHYPIRSSSKPKLNPKPGKYPVALLPGQYQDYYKEYTSDELKYLPINTVLYGPLKELQSVQVPSDGSQSDSDDSTGSEGSCCSSSQGTHDDSSSSSEKNDGKIGTISETAYKPKVKPNAICKMCKKGSEGKLEELVHCSECENSAHPSCIELTTDVVDVLKTYPWQCMDCKVCSHCTDPNNEDKMLFCDICDRGYHTFCVGLKNLPQGKWVCRRCGSCSICGATQPGPESSKAQWQYEVIKGMMDVDANRRPKIMCQSCFKKKR